MSQLSQWSLYSFNLHYKSLILYWNPIFALRENLNKRLYSTSFFFPRSQRLVGRFFFPKVATVFNASSSSLFKPLSQHYHFYFWLHIHLHFMMCIILIRSIFNPKYFFLSFAGFQWLVYALHQFLTRINWSKVINILVSLRKSSICHIYSTLSSTLYSQGLLGFTLLTHIMSYSIIKISSGSTGKLEF